MGTIERTPKGLFRVRRAGGKRETLAVLGALDEAESLLRGWNACIDDGSIAEPGAVTLGSFGEDWFLRREFHGNKRAEKVRDLDRERAAWTYQVLPSPIAKRPLDSIRVVDVEDWITWASKQKVMRLAGSGADRKPTPTSKTVSAQTVKHALRLIRQVLSDAVAREYISSNPAASVASPKNNGERPWTYATAKEIEQIASLPAEKARPILFAIYTGVRQAELWRMRWRDLDLDRKRYDFQEAARRIKAGKRVRRAEWSFCQSVFLSGDSRDTQHRLVFDSGYGRAPYSPILEDFEATDWEDA